MSETIEEPLLEGISKIDISPTMFKEATEHYKAIAKLFEEHGLEADFYPQGSFSTGTVVRPFDPDDEDRFYDLDMVCFVRDASPETTDPCDLRGRVRNILKSHGTYSGMLVEYGQCLTLEYKRTESRPGFNLDIVIGVSPSPATLGDYVAHGADPRWRSQDMSLATIEPDEWMGSNPHALCDWFAEINEGYLEYGREAAARSAFERSASVYASIAEVPEGLYRTSLQRAVQIAKRSRDVHYSRVDEKYSCPESCLLLVLIAECASKMPPSSGPVEILSNFVEVAGKWRTAFVSSVDSRLMTDGKWRVSNPVYPENLLEDWNSADARAFFTWTAELGSDLSVDARDAPVVNSSLNSLLGERTASRLRTVAAAAPAIVASRGSKPWKP